MSRPRTPEHFPRMKVRGGRRRRDAEITRAWRAFERVDLTTIVRAFNSLAAAVAETFATIKRALAEIRTATLVGFWLARRRARDQWLARRMLPATPSPWAAPIREATP